MRAETHRLEIVDHSWTKAKDLGILLSQAVYIIDIKIKQLHIVEVVCKLIEAYVGYGAVLLMSVYFFHAAALYVPETESWVDLWFSLLYFVLFIYAFKKTALPPLNVFPYLMVFYVLL